MFLKTYDGLLKLIQFDQPSCIYIVGQYLNAQNWHLVDHHKFAKNIWQEIVQSGVSNQISTTDVQTRVWLQYAAVLYNSCRQTERENYGQAWKELSDWLIHQTSFLNPNPDDLKVLVQETILELILRLHKSSLKPRAFLGYALQCLKNKNIDLHRRKNAAKRPEKDTLYLEEIDSTPPTGDPSHWEEKTIQPENVPEQPDIIMENEETREQLETFFRTHLSSNLQIQVAEAHFLDGLSPAEIARDMGKQPHEIRLIKARVVHKLRNLPSGELKTLLEILGSDRKIDGEVDQ